MKIIIDSIKAEVIDTSTVTENDFLIAQWIIRYTVMFPPKKETHISGSLSINILPNPKFIIDFIKDLYASVDEKLSKEPLVKYDL
jgi:hypothetical protein